MVLDPSPPPLLLSHDGALVRICILVCGSLYTLDEALFLSLQRCDCFHMTALFFEYTCLVHMHLFTRLDFFSDMQVSVIRLCSHDGANFLNMQGS